MAKLAYMPKVGNHTSLRYKSLLFLLSPVILSYIIYRSIKDGGWRYFCQRLGLNYPPSLSDSILIHCASVGEFNAAKPLILNLCERYPEEKIVISTNTPTAAQLVSKLQIKNILQIYLPLDYSVTVKALIKRISPKCILVLETEIWPTLFLLSANNNIPVAIVNGRISNKSLKANSIIKNDFETALQCLSVIFTRSEEDRSKFISVGAEASSTIKVGNLKYALKSHHHNNLPCTTIKRPFILAVSTHDDEESQLAQHINLLRKKNYLLVIAPRYPDRCKQLLRKFEQENIKVVLRSTQEETADNCDIYIVDTLGELDMYFNEAALVFVGGSLIQRGGHNILEPASFGKCVIVGPYTDNFEFETKELLEADGLIQVNDNHNLGVKLVQLLNNDVERAQYGDNAQKFIEQKSAILNEYLKLLQPIIKHTPS